MQVLSAILLLASAVFAQTGAALDIRCEGDTTHSGVAVWLWPGGQQCTSDAHGHARFDGLPGGDYRAEVVVDGYAPVDTTFSLQPGERRVVTVQLIPLRILSEVLVRTDRLSPAVKTYTRRDLERSTATNLGEFLSGQTGLDVRSDGLSGSAASVRIGGSNPNQVLVLVDGARWQDGGSGATDLSSIPVDWIERVSVYRGGSSDTGGEAIGGIIQVMTRSPGGTNELTSETTIHENSQRYSLSREHKVEQFGGLIAFTHLQGENDFRYRISADDGQGDFTPGLGRIFRRQNARVARDQVLVKFTGDFGGNWSGWVTGAWDRSDRGMPGYLAPLLTPDAQQKSAQSSVNVQAAHAENGEDFRFRASYQETWRGFQNLSPFALVQHSEERSRSAEAEARGQRLRKHTLIGYGASSAREFVSGDYLRDIAIRNRWAVWGNCRRVFINSKYWNAAAEAGARAEGFGSHRIALPKLGVSVTGSGQWRSGLDVGWGHSYRAPDFNSLFWQDDQLAVGNPDLKPERSSEWTGSAYAETPLAVSTRAEVNGSVQTVQDLIYWHRSFDNRWKPLNLEAANIRTVGVSVVQQLGLRGWQLQTAMDWTEARDASGDRNTGGKYLTFRPLNSQRIAAEYEGRLWSGEVAWRRVSARPILETNSKWLSPYRLVDAHIGYGWRIRRVELESRAGVNNLLNENYRIVRFAPMPLREWYITLRMRTT